MKDLIDITEVCEIAKISKPTIYRRVKKGTFPKPIKIRSKEKQGPRHVNRWERGEIMGWLLKGNNPEPLTLKEIAVKTEPGLNELFYARQGADLEDIYTTDDIMKVFEPKPTVWEKYKYIIMAVVAGAAAGILSGVL